MRNTGVQSIGIKLPIIHQGDNLEKIIVNSVLDSTQTDNQTYDLNDRDVIGITESVVARAQGNYVTIDEIVADLSRKGITKNLVLYSPIMSRNRFSMILKAFARFADNIVIAVNHDYDDQGNPTYGINPFTGIDIMAYYKELASAENCQLTYTTTSNYEIVNGRWKGIEFNETFIDCRCHPEKADQMTLANIMNKPILFSGANSKFGLLGSNKATEEKLKLFPEPVAAQELVENIQKTIFRMTGKHVVVCIYGDGCFHSPALNGMPGINEFADPVPMPAYTDKDLIEGCPNEGKLKYYGDLYPEKTVDELLEILHKDKGENSVGKMTAEGCTPRRRDALLASLMDLTSGSGDRATPVILIKNYL